MMNDQLTRDERIRLEALNQANISSIGATTDNTVKRAIVFETYIRSGVLKSEKKNEH